MATRAEDEAFWETTFRGRSYAQIIRSIAARLGDLRADFPQMAGFDPGATDRALRGPRKLIAYEHGTRMAPVNPTAAPGSHAAGEWAMEPASREGLVVTIEFLAPEESRARRAMSERRLPPSYIGRMFLEVQVRSGDAELGRRIRAILADEALRYDESAEVG